MKYRKKPVVVEAEQFFPADCELHDASYRLGIMVDKNKPYGSEGRWYVPTLEGNHIVTSGDWIITGVKGEKYPYKPDIFELTYEQVEELKMKANWQARSYFWTTAGDYPHSISHHDNRGFGETPQEAQEHLCGRLNESQLKDCFVIICFEQETNNIRRFYKQEIPSPQYEWIER